MGVWSRGFLRRVRFCVGGWLWFLANNRRILLFRNASSKIVYVVIEIWLFLNSELSKAALWDIPFPLLWDSRLSQNFWILSKFVTSSMISVLRSGTLACSGLCLLGSMTFFFSLNLLKLGSASTFIKIKFCVWTSVFLLRSWPSLDRQME